MNNIIQSNRMEIMSGEAWERHQRILALATSIEQNWLELCEELYQFKSNSDYEKLGYDTFQDYARAELQPKLSTIKNRFGVYKKLVLGLQVPGPVLAKIGAPKLQEIVPHVDKDNADELMAQAETLSYADLRKWLKVRFRPDKEELPEDLAPVEGERYKLIQGDMINVCAEFPDESFDAIVTDPPYPAEYLPLFEELAQVANRLLVPSGTMLVMSGQTHLPEVLRLMTQHITYRWTIAYLTPGKETRIWGRQIWTHWKPVLVFSKEGLIGDWAVDVVTSPAPDKEYHYWGQSLQGMRGLIEAFVLPNSRILDPFCGGGATIEAALDLGHECVGIDNDASAIMTIRERLNDKGRKNGLA